MLVNITVLVFTSYNLKRLGTKKKSTRKRERQKTKNPHPSVSLIFAFIFIFFLQKLFAKKKRVSTPTPHSLSICPQPTPPRKIEIKKNPLRELKDRGALHRWQLHYSNNVSKKSS